MKSNLLTFHGFDHDENGTFARFYVYGNFTAKMVAIQLADSDQLPLFEQVLNRPHTAKLKSCKDIITVRFPLHCNVKLANNEGKMEGLTIVPAEEDKLLFSSSHFISCELSGKVERQIAFQCKVVNQLTPTACFYDEDETGSSDR